MYSGWLISESSIKKLKNMFVEVHPDFIGHHVTFMFGKDSELPPEAEISVIGQCITETIQCFVVEVNGKVARPDSSIYHLTWTIDRSKGAKPVDSNKAILENGFDHFNTSIKIRGTPKIFKY
jgi:hypothetical protein